MTMSISMVLIAGFILASLPLLFARGLLGVPVFKTAKKMWVRVVEFLFAYALWIGFARVLEAQIGQVTRQEWQFYAVTFLLFLIAAFPAFVYRFLWRGHQSVS